MGEWKRPRYYRTGSCAVEKQCVEEEYRAVRERAGLIDVSTLGKLDVKGPTRASCSTSLHESLFGSAAGARALCGDVRRSGNPARRRHDFPAVGESLVHHTTTGNLDFVQQWLEWWLVGSGWDVAVTNVTGGMAAVNLAGPKARDVLRKLTGCPLETEAFPYMACREAQVAGAPALLMRIGFVGETGWEIHAPAEAGSHLWSELMQAGEEFGIRAFGIEAQRLLRLEKRHVIIGVDTDALTNPYEAGMGWVAKLDKADFIGRAALRRLETEPPQNSLVGFTMEGALPEDGAAVLVDGKLAGRVTSARYSPVNGKAVGLAWVPASSAREGAEIAVRVEGRPAPARVSTRAFYDPEGARLRM